MYNFDKVVNRKGTNCAKWDGPIHDYNNENIIPMWVADMDFEVAKPIVDRIVKRCAHPVFGYARKDEVVFEAIVKHFNTKCNHTITNEDIVLSTGVVYSIDACVRLFSEAGDKIMIHAPAYPPFRGVPTGNGRIIVDTLMKVEDGKYVFDFEDMEAKVEGCKMFILCNPQNDFHFAAILTSTFFNFSSSQLAKISRNKDTSYYDYLMKQNPSLLNEFNRIKDSHLSISGMIQECFKCNQFYDTCSLQDQTNCDYFYELALKYEKSTSLECTNFLSYVNDLKEQQTAQTSTIGKNDNVVRFMSIHNSKGLEFPIVYLWSSSTMKKNELSDMVLCDNELGVGFNIMQFPYRNIFKSYQRIAIEQKKNRDEIEEELRILYVATTRPKNELHIVDFLNPKLELDKGINYTKINARKGYTSWILQAMVNLNRLDLFRIEHVDQLWETTPIQINKKEYGIIEHYKDDQIIEYLSPSETEDTHFEVRPLSFDVKDAASRGTLYHTYIEKLPNTKWNKDMIQNVSNQYHLELDKYLMNDLLKLNENDLFDSLRNTKIYHEYPFIVQDKESVLQGYIDYLSIGNKIVLIDFKSDYVANDNILIHSSLKSFGNIKGEIIIEALTTYITEGLIVFPTHSWATMKQDNQVFDLKNTPSCVGALTNIALNTEGFKRSSHPTHSVCAYGNDKDEYLALDNNVNTPVNPNGCFGKVLSDKKFKLLFMGAPLSKITFVHSIEEEFDVEDRFTDHIYRFISKDGNKKRIYNMPKHFSTKNPHLSEHYEKLLGPMLNMEIAKKCYIGNSKTHIIDAYKCREYVYKLLEDDIHVFDDYREVKEFCYEIR